MGRKKNLDWIKNRLEMVKRVIEYRETAAEPVWDVLDEFYDEREALVWALRKLEAEEIGIGDRVKLKVHDDPDNEEGHQPEEGEVIGHRAGGFLIRPFTGPDSGTKTGLWYPTDWVNLVDP